MKDSCNRQCNRVRTKWRKCILYGAIGLLLISKMVILVVLKQNDVYINKRMLSQFPNVSEIFKNILDSPFLYKDLALSAENKTGGDFEDDEEEKPDDDVEDANTTVESTRWLSQLQVKAIDAAMDDMSPRKRQLMHWLFERYIIPRSPPDAIPWKAWTDRVERPGYFRPGNWDWTITKAGEYSPELYSPPPGELPQQRLPQAIIFGTGHCGTRALLDYLQMHPHIAVAHSEVHFFDNHFNQGIEWYRQQMPYAYTNQITLEKSPAYIDTARAPREIHKMNSSIKLLLVVRDPVSRLLSCFTRRVAGRKSYKYPFIIETDGRMSVNASLFSIARGMYSVHLKKWLRFFPLSQIHVLDGGDLVKEPVREIQAAQKFLELPTKLGAKNFYFNSTRGFYCMHPFTEKRPKCLGKGKGHPHVILDPKVKNMLYKFYEPYNQEFFKIIGKEFDWSPK